VTFLQHLDQQLSIHGKHIPLAICQHIHKQASIQVYSSLVHSQHINITTLWEVGMWGLRNIDPAWSSTCLSGWFTHRFISWRHRFYYAILFTNFLKCTLYCYHAFRMAPVHPCPPKLESRELHLISLCYQSIIGQQSDISWTNRLIFNQAGIRNFNETLQPTQTYKGINFDIKSSTTPIIGTPCVSHNL
jgi:hypothetical protein